MKFDHKKFGDALEAVSAAINLKNPMPALCGVELKDGKLTGTNLDTTITAEIDITDYKGEHIVFPAKHILSVVKMASKEIEITLDKEHNLATLKSGKSKYVIPLLNAEDYVVSTLFPEKSSVVNIDLLKDGWKFVKHSVANENSNKSFTGVLLQNHEEGLHMVTTDIHRISLYNVKNLAIADINEKGMVIPATSMENICKIFAGEVEVAFHDNRIFIKHGGLTFTARLITNEFPNYRPIISSDVIGKEIVSVLAQDFFQSIKRVMVVSESKTIATVIKFCGNIISTSLEEQGSSSSDEIFCEKGPDKEVVIGLNARYVLDIQGTTINVVSDGGLTPFRSYEDTATYFYATAVMPLRI